MRYKDTKDCVVKGIALNHRVKLETSQEARAECEKRGIELTEEPTITLGLLPIEYKCPVCRKSMEYSMDHVFTAAEAHPKSPPEARCNPPELHDMWKASIYKCTNGHVLLISDP